MNRRGFAVEPFSIMAGLFGHHDAVRLIEHLNDHVLPTLKNRTKSKQTAEMTFHVVRRVHVNTGIEGEGSTTHHQPSVTNRSAFCELRPQPPGGVNQPSWVEWANTMQTRQGEERLLAVPRIRALLFFYGLYSVRYSCRHGVMIFGKQGTRFFRCFGISDRDKDISPPGQIINARNLE